MPKRQSRRAMRWTAALAAALGFACSQPPPPSGPVRPEEASSRASRPWYGSAATRHDFGRVLAGADSERRHTYRVVNASRRPVKVSRAVNLKPCCGDVTEIEPATLEPGQGVEVTVTLKVGPGAGRLEHVAVLKSDDPDHPEVGLTTRATCLPSAAVDEVEPSHPTLLAGEGARVAFVIHSYGDEATPPLELDDRVVRCGEPIEWTGPQSRGIDPDTGSPEHRRGLVVALEARGEPGPRATDVLVMEGDLAVGRRRISWEVAEAIAATPTGLIVSRADDEAVRRVLLRSRDGRPFRILSATTRVEGLDVRVDEDGPKAAHAIEARVGPASRRGPRIGEVLVATDHARQPAVKVAVYIAATPEPAAAAAEGGSR